MNDHHHPLSASSANDERLAEYRQSSNDSGNDKGYAAVEQALNGTFGILKYVMALLMLTFCGSGLFFVEEGNIAIHTRLGAVVGESGKKINFPGGPYFALPSPIDEVRIVPMTLQEVVLDKEFWFHESPAETGLPLERQTVLLSLAPDIDGSLLTGDKNIVHACWSASFRIVQANDSTQENAMLFFRNVGTIEHAKTIVAEALQRAAVRLTGQTPVDGFYKGDLDTDIARADMQKEMDRLKTGLSVVTVSLKNRTVPLVTLRDFQAAGQAESEKVKSIESANQERTRILNQTVGAAYEKFLLELDEYEKARAGGNAIRIKNSEAVINDLLLGDEVGGSVSALINDAITLRTQTVEMVRGASQRFQAMLDLYNENPKLYRSRQIQDAIQRIFQNQGNETFHLPAKGGKTLYLELGRDKK